MGIEKIISYQSAPHTMIYNNIPLIIPILAAGYLLTVYLLLVLAQRSFKGSTESLSNSKQHSQPEAIVTPKVREASSMR